MKTNERTFIISDSLVVAKNYAWDNNLGRMGVDWEYLRETRQVQGTHGGKYFICIVNDPPRNYLDLITLLKLAEYKPGYA